MAMAVELDADLAVEEVSGLKKRGRNPKANVAATAFHWKVLAKCLESQANGATPAVRRFEIYLRKEAKAEPHDRQADLVAEAGLVIRQKVDRRDR